MASGVRGPGSLQSKVGCQSHISNHGMPAPSQVNDQERHKRTKHRESEQKRVEICHQSVLVTVWKVVAGSEHMKVADEEQIENEQQSQNPEGDSHGATFDDNQRGELNDPVHGTRGLQFERDDRVSL